LQVPAIHLVLNDVPDNLDLEDARLQLEKTYQCEGGTVLNHTEELMSLSSSQPFVLRYPEHPLTARIKKLAEQL
jgi:MinD-like ATPase involved in chromosome partitioning or flagellar assembly